MREQSRQATDDSDGYVSSGEDSEEEQPLVRTNLDGLSVAALKTKIRGLEQRLHNSQRKCKRLTKKWKYAEKVAKSIPNTMKSRAPSIKIYWTPEEEVLLQDEVNKTDRNEKMRWEKIATNVAAIYPKRSLDSCRNHYELMKRKGRARESAGNTSEPPSMSNKPINHGNVEQGLTPPTANHHSVQLTSGVEPGIVAGSTANISSNHFPSTSQGSLDISSQTLYQRVQVGSMAIFVPSNGDNSCCPAPNLPKEGPDFTSSLLTPSLPANGNSNDFIFLDAPNGDSAFAPTPPSMSFPNNGYNDSFNAPHVPNQGFAGIPNTPMQSFPNNGFNYGFQASSVDHPGLASIPNTPMYSAPNNGFNNDFQVSTVAHQSFASIPNTPIQSFQPNGSNTGFQASNVTNQGLASISNLPTSSFPNNDNNNNSCGLLAPSQISIPTTFNVMGSSTNTVVAPLHAPQRTTTQTLQQCVSEQTLPERSVFLQTPKTPKRALSPSQLDSPAGSPCPSPRLAKSAHEHKRLKSVSGDGGPQRANIGVINTTVSKSHLGGQNKSAPIKTAKHTSDKPRPNSARLPVNGSKKVVNGVRNTEIAKANVMSNFAIGGVRKSWEDPIQYKRAKEIIDVPSDTDSDEEVEPSSSVTDHGFLPETTVEHTVSVDAHDSLVEDAAEPPESDTRPDGSLFGDGNDADEESVDELEKELEAELLRNDAQMEVTQGSQNDIVLGSLEEHDEDRVDDEAEDVQMDDEIEEEQSDDEIQEGQMDDEMDDTTQEEQMENAAEEPVDPAGEESEVSVEE